ncbi:MAG: TonB-dependent receptor [Pyrinomonadaceae bacterium]|nr:TonB-dependent receptor [Pyrinomonadaceae bacterium]
MSSRTRHTFVSIIAICVIVWNCAANVSAQSQASNGQIEGTIIDANGASVANAVVSVTNVESGATRSVATASTGVYRLPLLPLGSYRITAEAPNFKRFVRDRVILSAGETATVDIQLQTGTLEESVTVSADSAISDAGKADMGRVMDQREVRNMPLIYRNPLNFGFLQNNVTGRQARSFGFPRLSVNGYLLRVNHLLDGNTNTVYNDRSRLMNLSEMFVSEVQLVTNGYAAEFGDTPGMIMNVITPSGTNELHGSVSYRLRRPPFYSRPFFFPAADLPDNKTDIFTAAVGAPIIEDRWQFYFGFEKQYREDKAMAGRLLTITPANRDRLIGAGLSPSIFPAAIPVLDRGNFYIVRTDAQLNRHNRLTARFNLADLSTDNSIAGGRNTLERSSDNFTRNWGFAIQLASYTQVTLNEFRFQYGRSAQGRRRNEFSGTGPSIVINNVANFGSPTNVDTVFPPQQVTQFQNNVSRTTGTHVVKVGGGFSRHDYAERAAVFSLYRFPNLNAYIDARSGVNRKSYSSYEETFGDPGTRYTAVYWNFFAQDDWKATRRLKLTYGLRYDLYRLPKADPTSVIELSRKFTIDKNDLAPRFGVVYALREGRRPTIIRAGAGLYYDAPLLSIYRDVLRVNGNSRFFSYTFTPNAVGSPTFPNTVGNLPPGSVLPDQDIYTIAKDFDTMYAIHSHIQIDHAITDDLSFIAGYVRSAGRHLNVYRNINPINPVAQLADGRPVFGDDKLFPDLGWIVIAESAGRAQYDALALQLKQRLNRGMQFSIHYTLSKGINDAPDGDREGLFLSDPTNRSVDMGYSSADQRHTFVMTFVGQPRFRLRSRFLSHVLNNNQFGIIATANSGTRFSVYSEFDLNNDGFDFDRPVGFKRNSEKTPNEYNLDLKYTRVVSLSEKFKLELFAEFQNLLNIRNIVGYSNISVTTDPVTGNLIGPLPDFRARNESVALDSRQFQLGVKLSF